ncbi:TlpA disulfide reductase family protein [Novosphingobium sp.]|uniref:TlpA family protein disulfide reductase n=1 Tax=Novosphingobium sp. TaxID=1874826 RepID=UPI003420451B
MPLISPRPFAFMVPLVAAGLLAGCDKQTPADTQPQSAASAPAAQAEAPSPPNGSLDISNRGAAMPDFTFSDPSGKKIRLLDLKGKPVLINLWATWCGPCKLEMPALDALAGAKADKLAVLTISQDSDQAAAVDAFFKDRKLTHLAPWLDPENALSQHYNTGVLPTTVLYDAQGKEVWRMIGSHDWAGPRTDAMLADTLR